MLRGRRPRLSAAVFGKVGHMSPKLVESCYPTANTTPLIRRAWYKYQEPDLPDPGFLENFLHHIQANFLVGSINPRQGTVVNPRLPCSSFRTPAFYPFLSY